MLSAAATRAAPLASFGPISLYDSPNSNGVVEAEIRTVGNKLNLIDDAFMQGLHEAMRYVDQDMEQSARVVILLGAEDRPFSAGLDLTAATKIFTKDMPALDKAKVALGAMTGTAVSASDGKGMPAMRAQELHLLIKRWQDSISSLARCRVPVIAAVHSHCIGGAVSLATACDMRYCTSDATFSVKEVQIGITPDIGTIQRLPQLVGEGRARELTLTARKFTAQQAAAYGLMEGVFANRDEMLEGVRSVAEQIAANSPIAVQGAKRVFNFQTEKTAQESLDYVRMWNAAFLKSDDLMAAGAAFASKKKASFSNYVIDDSTPKRR